MDIAVNKMPKFRKPKVDIKQKNKPVNNNNWHRNISSAYEEKPENL